ncbi:hypothetical protein METP2_02471 [Methanosarcinales archaeon]|nr:hypothetical protein [Candidatus Methanoperedens sp.]CAG0989225.1 hypothetical protein METP2_02471 [Methanosarcinales archaeon]
MMTKQRREIIKRLDRLPFEIQIKILDLAEAAAPSPQKGVSGKKLLRFTGILNADDVTDMTQAIENGCDKLVFTSCKPGI